MPTVTKTHSVSLEMVEVSPDMAREWIATRRPDYQRLVQQWHVDELAEYMRSGEFNPNVPVTFNKTPNGHILIDGQHRLLAIEATRRTYSLPIVTVEVETEDDAHINMLRTDAGLGRTKSDAIHTMELNKKFGLTKRALMAISAAANLVENKFNSPSGRNTKERDRDELVRRLEKWSEHGWQYLQAIEGRKYLKKRLQAAPCMAIGMVTFSDAKAKAHDFWRSVATNAGLKEGSGEQMLVELLSLHSNWSGRERDNVCRRVAACWNAAYKDEEIKNIPRVDHRLPCIISGTRFDR